MKSHAQGGEGGQGRCTTKRVSSAGAGKVASAQTTDINTDRPTRRTPVSMIPSFKAERSDVRRSNQGAPGRQPDPAPVRGRCANRRQQAVRRVEDAVGVVAVDRLKMGLLRVRFDKQARGERRKQACLAIESAVATTLKPWREIVTPHRDVASGQVPAGRVRRRSLAGAIGRGAPTSAAIRSSSFGVRILPRA